MVDYLTEADMAAIAPRRKAGARQQPVQANNYLSDDDVAGIVGQQAPPQQAPQPSMLESSGRGALQGATMGFADEASGAMAAAMQKAFSNDPETFTELYRRYRNSDRSQNAAAQEANPGSYMAGQIGGGMATAAFGGAPATLGKAAIAGAGLGAAAGLGGSNADLTKGDIAGAAKDTAIGAAVGGVAGAAGAALGKAASGVAARLKEVGRSRLFKAAVGQNKRAFTQTNAKGLFQKSSEYLDELGVGVGDSTESIGTKLSARAEKLTSSLDDMVSSLDEASAAKVSPLDVALRIEKEVAAPLKKIAANQGEYREAMGAVDDIVGLGQQEIGFAEAAAQRRAVQQKINYDKINGREVSADVNRKIAQIWNDAIDAKAEPILKAMGKGGDAYRELRHEYQLVAELSKHVESRVSGNAANRVISPSDYGAGGVAGIMTSNPFVGIATAAANHLARVYGNAAAGRGIINVAKMAAGSQAGMRAFVPAAGRAAVDGEGY